MLTEFLCRLRELASDAQDQRVLGSETGLAHAEDELRAHVMNHLSYLTSEDWKRELITPAECVRADLRKLEQKLGEEFGL